MNVSANKWLGTHSDTALVEPDVVVPGTTRLNGRALFWLLQCAGWLGFGAVMFAWGLAYFSPIDALVNKGVLVGLGFALTLAMRSIYHRLRTRRLRKSFTGAAIIASSFIGATIWIESQSILFQAYFVVIHGGRFAIESAAAEFGTVMYYGFVLLTWSLLYYGVNAWDDAEHERHRAERAEALAQSARLRALQAQLNPHFIFNALNIVSTLVDEGQNAAAKQMIARLSEFLRRALDTLDTPEITVAEEIEFVRSYLDIEHVRFGARLQAAIDVTPAALRALIPTLILQPLVENSVKHGILAQELGGSVGIHIATDGELLRIAVTDNGRGAEGETSPRRGIGLSNAAKRLNELYGNQAYLSFTNTKRGGETTLEIPLRFSAPPAPVSLGGKGT